MHTWLFSPFNGGLKPLLCTLHTAASYFTRGAVAHESRFLITCQNKCSLPRLRFHKGGAKGESLLVLLLRRDKVSPVFLIPLLASMTVAPRSNSMKSSLIVAASKRSFKNRRDHWAALPFIAAFQGWRAHLSFRAVYLLAFLEGCVSGRQSFPECLVNTFRISARQFDYVWRCGTRLLHTVSSFLLTESHLLIKVDVVQVKLWA